MNMKNLDDILHLCGALLITAGFWRWSVPAGLIVLGSFAMLAGFVVGVPTKSTDTPEED